VRIGHHEETGETDVIVSSRFDIAAFRVQQRQALSSPLFWRIIRAAAAAAPEVAAGAGERKDK